MSEASGLLNTLFADRIPVPSHRGCACYECRNEDWHAIAAALRERKLDLLALWGEHDSVCAALYEATTHSVTVARLHTTHNQAPSLGAYHAPAIRLERALQDLFDIELLGLPDTRPWLDHGRWPLRAPLASTPVPAREYGAYAFLPAEGPALHEIPVGPVHAGIIEPGHFRFSAHGEMVVRLEQRLGYTHKGIDKLMQGATLEQAARLASRVSGDSTVAYAFAFARAVETALQIEAPPRAQWLRGIYAELERMANHLGDIGAICNDAAFALMLAECGMLREQVLRVCGSCFGHRLMMDRIVPGGVVADLDERGLAAVRAVLAVIRRRFPELIELYDNTASLQDRTVGTGVVDAALVRQFAAGGYVGRASGRHFDVRSSLPYEPYRSLPIEPVSRSAGDVDARVWVRIEEVQRSIDWLDKALASLPSGAIRTPVIAPPTVTAATALVEGFRGDVLAYVRIDSRLHIERCHLRDPSWFQWPLLEAAIDGNIVADFPLCNKSFNCSYSGHDL